MAVKSAPKKPVANARKKATAPAAGRLPAIEKPYSTSEMVSHLSTETEVSQGKVKAILLTLQNLIAGHLQSKQPFSLLGLLKIQVVTKPATKARKGTNPLTGKPMTIPAKPAHPAVKLKALKKLKEMIG